MPRKGVPDGVAVMARADVAGEPWTVELLFDFGEVGAVAKAAKDGREYVDGGFCPLGVKVRTGRGGRPKTAWFRNETEALTFYQREIRRMLREGR